MHSSLLARLSEKNFNDSICYQAGGWLLFIDIKVNPSGKVSERTYLRRSDRRSESPPQFAPIGAR